MTGDSKNDSDRLGITASSLVSRTHISGLHTVFSVLFSLYFN